MVTQSSVVTGSGGTIAASGTTAIVPTNSVSRIEVINCSAATLWARWGGVPAVNGAGSFPIVANGSYSPAMNISGSLQLLSTAANQTYTVNTFA